MGAAKQAWGWYPAGKVWVPLQVDVDGKVVVDMSAIHTLLDADEDTGWDVEKTADEDKIHGKVKGVEAFLLDADGILTLAKQSAARAYKHAADQSIPNSTYTKVVLEAESYDIQGEFDPVTNYRFTAKAAGLYLCVGMLDYEPVVDQTIYQMAIYKNGVFFQACNCYSSGTTAGTPLIVAVVQLAASDYLEAYALQFSGATATLVCAWDGCWLTVVKIA